MEKENDTRTRLLAAVEAGGEPVKFGPDVTAHTQATGDLYRVEVKGSQPDGFQWDEATELSWWEGALIEDAVEAVSRALGGPTRPPAAEKEFTLSSKGMSLAEIVGEPAIVTKPYTKLSDAPANIRELNGAKLTLAQVNWIANQADGLEGQEGIESPWGVAIGNFKRLNKKEGDKWVEKKKELSKDEELSVIREAFWQQYGDGTGVAKAAGPWVKDVFDSYLVAQEGMTYYQVPYTSVAGEVEFAPRGEWPEVKVSYQPTGEQKELSEPTLRMATAVAKAILKRQDSVTTVWREDDGRRYYMALVSMSIHDDEEQLVTKEGMDFSIDISKKYDYHSGLYIRHVVPITLVGRSLYERRLGPYWIEVGTFDDTPLADRAYEILEKDEDGKWKLSIGFITTRAQERKGRYTRLLKYDSTITDRPALRVTQMLALGGKDKMEALAKVLELLNSDGGKETDMAMLAEVFGLEEKELTAKVKEVKGMAKVKAAIAELEDDDAKKKLLAAIGGGDEDDEEKKKAAAAAAKKETMLDPDVVQALKEMLGASDDDDDGDDPLVVEPVPDVAETVKAAIQEAVVPLIERVDALEARPGAEAIAETISNELKELFAGFKPKDPLKPSVTAPVIPGAEELLANLQKQLGAQPTGKHVLAGMAGGPGPAEGG